ncbi:MAG TPA: hypothetical protein VME68_02370 [Acidobacteriaceae bacterium]|nr:hypothetical protein [Acidobacteriaceae bacterium]
MHRKTIGGWLIALAMLVAPVSAGAQRKLSFDPDTAGACERELGHGSASDWVGDERSFELSCAEDDLRRERAELAALMERERQAKITERKAWANLLKAFEPFRTLHLEIFSRSCGGGNGCGADTEQAEARANFQFLWMMEGFRGGALPSGSDADLAAADAKLNAEYRNALSSEEPCRNDDETCIPPELTRNMERAWMCYRDAWVAYARLRWPQIAEASWRAYLTERRLQLGGDSSER